VTVYFIIIFCFTCVILALTPVATVRISRGYLHDKPRCKDALPTNSLSRDDFVGGMISMLKSEIG
jgi:hypothetical protein